MQARNFYINVQPVTMKIIFRDEESNQAEIPDGSKTPAERPHCQNAPRTMGNKASTADSDLTEDHIDDDDPEATMIRLLGEQRALYGSSWVRPANPQEIEIMSRVCCRIVRAIERGVRSPEQSIVVEKHLETRLRDGRSPFTIQYISDVHLEFCRDIIDAELIAAMQCSWRAILRSHFQV